MVVAALNMAAVTCGGCRNVVVHETGDPDVIVVEYELVGTHTATGVTASALFIGVLRTSHGILAQWREYQHTLAIAQAVGQAQAGTTEVLL
ncbi:hypothetical protein Vse01_00090 [Micromonospora sediminimaris]|uniref:SnoaL-like domain-containing protein n=2 Tax=Micromonospora sediminimaris TaxID=547162 RepID=A0A9W5XHF1_9ACTN|nr:hypothetical protein Vse01_00090 [Micromonospora sediminimaris]